MRKWLLLVVMAMVSTGLLASCGRQEPVGSLRVVSEPAGAAIRLDGVETGDATPADLLLPVGQHTVAVNRSGYLITPAQRTLNVPAGRQVLASFALAELGELTVTSAPAGADIVLDGDASGEVTPHTFSLVIGPHTVAVALADHVAEGGGTTIDLQSGVPHTVEFTMLPAGTLTVTSTPADARILIDDTDTGEMTPATVTLAVGDYAVRVEKDGYVSDPASRDVSIAAGAGEFADFTLTSTGALGSLSVTSVPSGAAISLDGDDTGEVTPHVFALAAGAYDVVVERRNFHAPTTQRVDVQPAGESDADFALTPRKIVLMETVSAVNCIGCPAMHEQEVEVAAAGYGPDKVVGIQYSEGWLGPDPHHEANPGDNIARARNLYWADTPWGGAMPAMFLDGTLAELTEPNYPQPASVMMDSLDAHLARQPGFAIDVAVDDLHAAAFTVSIDLVAVEEVTGPNARLHVCVVETPVLYDEPPGSEGETEFHWIMREFETLAAPPLPVSPAAAGHFEIELTAGDGWVADNLAVIAFVQDDVTLEVLQAGITDTLHAGDPE